MKIVVDTNVILRALIKNSKVRGILLSPRHRFYILEYALEETRKHLKENHAPPPQTHSAMDQALDGYQT